MVHMPIDQMGYAPAMPRSARLDGLADLAKRIRWARVSALVLGVALWAPVALALKVVF